jgi:hypothetical protein
MVKDKIQHGDEQVKTSFTVRDQRKPGHHWADNEVIDDFGASIGPFGYAVYMYICRHAGNRDGRCYKRQRDVAEAFGMSRHTVLRAIETLIEQGLVGKEDTPGKPCIYLVLEVPKRLRNLPPTAATPTAVSGNHLSPTATTPVAASNTHLSPTATDLSPTATDLSLTATRNKEVRLSQDFSQDLRAGKYRAALSQPERDSWDLRRWQDTMRKTEPQPGAHIPDPDAHWRARARNAAFEAGLSPERIVQLLKQHFPNDPNVDLLYEQKPLFQESA